jgi:hypothetical protein
MEKPKDSNTILKVYEVSKKIRIERGQEKWQRCFPEMKICGMIVRYGGKERVEGEQAVANR